MKKKIIVVLFTLILTSVCGAFAYETLFFVSTDDAQIQGHNLMIAPKISGFVTKVDFKEGQAVKKGDVLLEIDAREYLNSLEENKATLASLSFRLQDSLKNFQRATSLFKQGATSKQQYDSAATNYLDIKSQFDNVKAKVAQAELNIEFTKVRAPFDGQIAKSSVDVGEFASVGVPLIGFVDSSERWVMANFKETEIASLYPGQSATVEVDAYPGKRYEAEVYALTNATGATFTLLPPDNASGNFTKIVQRVPVRIQFKSLTKDDLNKLKSGLSVFVKIRKNK
jgi:membrane fusion protein (multidrug efflux system)